MVEVLFPLLIVMVMVTSAAGLVKLARRRLCRRMSSASGETDVERLFRRGESPTLLRAGEVASEWRVDVLSGPLPSMGGWPLRHRKRFDLTPLGDVRGRVAGHNVFRDDLRWGRFSVVDVVTGSFRAFSCLDYDVDGNSWPVRRMLDYIRQPADRPDLVVGLYGLVLWGRYRKLGHFTLTRIVESAKRRI